MNTKEIILDVSLKLFAQNGYDGVSVRQIAKEVGVRESALYKHFKNKEDILHCVIEECQSRIHNAYVENEVPETVMTDIARGYRQLSKDKLFEISWNLFQLYTKDPIVANFRRLLMREQFSHSFIADLYNQFFLKGVIQKQSKTFAALVKGSYFEECNPEIIALQFYSPIFLLFQQYDCDPASEEEIKKLLYAHIRKFGEHYEQKK